MKKIDSFTKASHIVGIIITTWILFLVVIELSRAFQEGIEHFFYTTTDIISLSYPYIDPNALILIYLIGFAMVWWKKLWGAVMILTVSILGIILSQAGDVRIHFILTFLVGFLYLANWNDKRKVKNNAS